VTNTFAGIRSVDAPWFVGAELAGAFAATLLFEWLIPSVRVSLVFEHGGEVESQTDYV
jgi:hypothetical protein